MIIVSKLLHFLSEYRFFLMPGLVGIPALIILLRKNSLAYKRQRIILPGLAAVAVLFLVWGPDLNNRFVYRYGLEGKAIITGTERTSTSINHKRVMRFQTTLKTAEGKVVHTSFNTSEPIVYPNVEGAYYPPAEEPFTVKYIPGDEDNFIILSNDMSSAYARMMSCGRLMQDISAARANFVFDSSAAARAAYKASIAAYISSTCADSSVVKMYEAILKKL